MFGHYSRVNDTQERCTDNATAVNDAPKPTDIQKICEVGQQTQKAWKDLDMGFYINST